MPYTGLTAILNEIPKRTRQWVHQHYVPDVLGPDNKMYPSPANRAERRAAGRPGGPFGWMVAPSTTPYEKPVAEAEEFPTLPEHILAMKTDPATGHLVVG
jgi:hypothetical protein